MLLEPLCFIRFVEDNDIPVIEYIDNWTVGAKVKYHFFNDDILIDMEHCVHVIVAKEYLIKLNAHHLITQVEKLECPCSDT